MISEIYRVKSGARYLQCKSLLPEVLGNGLNTVALGSFYCLK